MAAPKIAISEKRIQKCMELLNISYDEAKQMLIDDAKIDAGERMEFDLTPEEEKRAKKFANVTEYKQPKTRKNSRPPSATKIALIEFFFNALNGNNNFQAENIIIEKPGKRINFIIGDKSYTLDLIQHNVPKE